MINLLDLIDLGFWHGLQIHEFDSNNILKNENKISDFYLNFFNNFIL